MKITVERFLPFFNLDLQNKTQLRIIYNILEDEYYSNKERKDKFYECEVSNIRFISDDCSIKYIKVDLNFLER